jgi:putative sterol carrier protein
MTDPRDLTIEALLERLPEFVDASRWNGDEVALELRLTGADDGSVDRVDLILGDGRAQAGRDLDVVPAVTLEVEAVDLLRLITGEVDPAIMFLTGDFRLEGDPRLAVEVAACLRMPVDGTTVQPTAVDAAAVARVVATVEESELRERLGGGVRDLVLDEIFARFPDYLDAHGVAGVSETFGFRITSATGAPAALFVVELRDGHCEVHRGDGPVPRVTLELDDVEFLRLVTGNGNPAALWLTGGLKLEGDERFALELAGFFRVPTAGDSATRIDPTSVDAVEIARVIRSVPDAELRERMSGGMRSVILDEIFRRFPEYLDLERASEVDATVSWKLTGRADGGADRYLTVIDHGTCRAGQDLDVDPSVTIRIDGTDFLKLVTGNSNPVMSFLRGKIKIRGDLGFAAQLTALFKIPSPG